MKTKFLVTLVVMCITGSLYAQMQIDSLRVIFSPGNDIYLQMFELKKAKLFKPDLQQVNQADSIARNFVNDFYTFKKLYWDSVLNMWMAETPTYEYDYNHRQYIGAVINDKKVILINGMAFVREYFTRTMVCPAGGGGLYFRIQVDLENRKVVNYVSNASL